MHRTRRPHRHVEHEPVVQRRITVGAANDRHERQADEVASHVLANLAAATSAPPTVTVDPSTRVQRMSFRTAAPRATSGTSETRVQRRSDAGGIGPEGGEVDADTQARLDRTIGRGAALDPGLRRSMEQGFGGVDFGNVRLHTDGEAAELSQRLGAQAFTMGSDIYLGAGTPALDSPSGQGLLAHELTHTMQQQGSAQRRIRRLAYNKPIKNVVSINVFSGGSSGQVAQVSDGKKPVIVKANQANAAEVVAADKMLRGGRFKSGGYKVKAPKSRIASSSDIAELKAKVTSPGVMTSPDPRNFVTGLDGQYPTIIAESMDGEMLDTQLKNAVTKTQSVGDDGKKTTTYTRDDATVSAIKKLVSTTAPVKALAKSMAADAAMGMQDRILTYFNAQNFLFDPKTKKFNFVDNTSSDASGSLTSKITTDGLENARSNFNMWASKGFVAQLVSDPDALATRIVENYTGLKADGEQNAGRWGIIAPFVLQGRAGREDNDMNDVYNELSSTILAKHASLVAAASAGVKAGRESVVKQLANPLALTAGLPQNMRLEAVTALLARRAILKGTATSPDAAWESANVEAHKLLKMRFKPAAPALNSQAFLHANKALLD